MYQLLEIPEILKTKVCGVYCLSDRFQVQFLFSKNHLFHYMVFLDDFFFKCSSKETILTRRWFLGCFFNATWSHFPWSCSQWTKKWFNKKNLGKINWGSTSSQNSFACFHGENIQGSCKVLNFQKVAQWMNGHLIFHPYIFIHYTTSTFHLSIKFSSFTLCHLRP